MGRLTGKAILVTGAGSGIGKAAALMFAQEGALVAAVDINEDTLAETVRGAKGDIVAIMADVTSSEQVQRAVTQTVAAFGRLNGLFNVVGISGRRFGDGPVDTCTEEGWEHVLNVNLTSMFLMCKYSVPNLLNAGGAIVNLSSVLGIVGGDEDFNTHAYAASKAGIIGLSRAMAATYAPNGLRVNVIAPGLIATAMSQRAQSDERIMGRLKQLQPLTGAMGEPEDVAAAALYLLSDEAYFVTGAVLTVDGGWTVH